MQQHSVDALLLQAEAQLKLQQLPEALQALDLAIQLQPGHPQALWMRAAAHAAAGHHTACFMDLRTLSCQQPTYPGLTKALQQAARAVSQQQATRSTATPPPRKTYIRHTRRTQAAGSSTGSGTAAAATQQQRASYAVLGLQPDASAQAVRQAYKQLAARLHPDKWVLGTPEQQAAAEEEFKQVAAAYQSIMAVEQMGQP